MAFHFQKASCVVAGTFNMYILHPQWLDKKGIIEQGLEVGIETNLTQPGFRFRFANYEATWSVSPNRIVVESVDPKIDCGRSVAGVLRELPETPLFAIGNNVHYRAELSELEHLAEAIRNYPKMPPPAAEQSVVQRTFHVGVKQREHETVNLQISLKEDSIELMCNVHSDVGQQDKPNTAAVAAAERFFDDRAECKQLAQHFFGTSIDHDSDNS